MRASNIAKCAAVLLALAAVEKPASVKATDGWPCGWVYDYVDSGEEISIHLHGWNAGSYTVVYTHPDYTTHSQTAGWMVDHPGHTYCPHG